MQMSLQEKLEEKIRVLELDKISLIKELQHINAEIDHKVESRTEELKISNRKLLNEIAERKRSEQALRESEHKFRELFHNANDAIYLWEVKEDDTIGRCLEVNDVACRMLGYSREELLTFTPKDIDTRDAARGIPRVTRKLLKEKHITFEMIHKAKDGREIPVEINSHIFDLSGRGVVLSVTRDISERKKAEWALNQQNLYLSALHETTLGLMSRLDLRDSLKTIIDRAAALVQTQNGFIFLYDPQANELVLRVGVGVYNKREGLVLKPGEGLAGKVWQTGEFLIVDDYSTWQGRTFDSIFDNLHSVIGVPLRSEHQVIGVIGLGYFDTDNRFEDDTVTALGQFAELASIALYNAQLYSKLAKELNERKQAERALKESHETFLTVLDSIDATIYVADMDTYEIIFMNKHMEDSFGGNLEGKLCWKVFRGESEPCNHCTNDQLLDAAGNPTGVCVWESENPVTAKWYINYDRAIKWVDGRYVRLQIATDITKIKELEAERLQTEAQLLQAQKMEAIGTLAGGIAHDFNNILTAILGYAELTGFDLERDSHASQNLGNVIKASHRAKDLVKQILSFSRQNEKEKKPIIISSIIKESIKLLRISLPTTIEIRQDIESNPGIINANPTQIHQVMMNLCTNAAHAMSEKGGVLEVTLANVALDASAELIHPDLQPGQYLRLTVSDTGEGMPAEILERIFEPYFTTKDISKGTGLGLAVVHSIVKSHQGTVKAQSESGKGTNFTVYFPIIRKDPLVEKKVTESIPKGEERILYVDDEKALVDIGQQMLKRLGYTVVTKTNSLEALEEFQKGPEKFDLVITDMTMPNLTGVELSQRLMEIRPDLPIILCTGYSEKIDAQMAKSMGIRGFLMKPPAIQDMANTIREVLNHDF